MRYAFLQILAASLLMLGVAMIVVSFPEAVLADEGYECCASKATAVAETHEMGTCEWWVNPNDVFDFGCRGACPVGPHDGKFKQGITNGICGTTTTFLLNPGCSLGNFNNIETKYYTLTCTERTATTCHCLVTEGDATGDTPSYQNCTASSTDCP